LSAAVIVLTIATLFSALLNGVAANAIGMNATRSSEQRLYGALSEAVGADERFGSLNSIPYCANFSHGIDNRCEITRNFTHQSCRPLWVSGKTSSAPWLGARLDGISVWLVEEFLPYEERIEQVLLEDQGMVSVGRQDCNGFVYLDFAP
jgi:hypothetical protein